MSSLPAMTSVPLTNSLATPSPLQDSAPSPPILSKAPAATPTITRNLWLVGLVFGVGTQIFFLITAWNLFLFLRYGSSTQGSYWIATDTLLALFFAWPHSLLLVPSVQKRLKSLVPGAWMGLIHCSVTCISLWMLYWGWRTVDVYLWRLEGWAAQGMLFGFYASWIALFYSLYLTGMGYQTGLTPWWYWIRSTPLPRRPFVRHGAFRWMRHPVYMSFLGLIWFTPTMSLDHAILTGIWTLYIYIGSYMKDRRLEHFIGEDYRAYGRQVTGFPLIGFGPWGRFRN